MDLIFAPVTVAGLVALAVLALALACKPNPSTQVVENRLSDFLHTGLEGRGATGVDPALQGSFVERVLLPALRRIVQAFGRLAPASTTERINQQLTLAGRPANLTALDFLGLRVLLAAAGLGLGIWYASQAGGGLRLYILGPGGGVAAGYMLPGLWLSGLIKKRKDIIQRALPDALDMLTICVEAGLAFESGLQRVSEQWQGALSQEFGRVVAEIRLGVSRPQALRRLAQRCGIADMTSFVAVLVQADSMGTSIAHVLHSQADQMRVLRRQRAHEAANKAPIKMLIPMLLFIFPALFVVILGPALPKIMDTFANMGGK